MYVSTTSKVSLSENSVGDCDGGTLVLTYATQILYDSLFRR